MDSCTLYLWSFFEPVSWYVLAGAKHHDRKSNGSVNLSRLILVVRWLSFCVCVFEIFHTFPAQNSLELVLTLYCFDLFWDVFLALAVKRRILVASRGTAQPGFDKEQVNPSQPFGLMVGHQGT